MSEAREFWRRHYEEHPPAPMPEDLERKLVAAWGPMAVNGKPKRKRKAA